MVGGGEVPIVGGAGLAVALVEDDELELGGRQGRPAAFGQSPELSLEDLARGGENGSVVVPEQVGEHQGGAFVPRGLPQR